jgi:Zn-dependent peptidase ImmA (M78 family)
MMAMNRECEQAARDFWKQVDDVLPGYDALYPRRIDIAIAAALPVTIVPIPELSTDKVANWLVEHAIDAGERVSVRRLRGCLIARSGKGLIFHEATDDLAETRLTLAHEAAHFIQHYWSPRQSALRKLGDSILPVLDGSRAPTLEERLSGLLRGCQFGQFEHIFSRDGYDGLRDDAEVDADELAFELLAPRREVVRAARRRNRTLKPATLIEALRSDFGFPCWAATAAASSIYASKRQQDSWLASIRRAHQRDQQKSSKVLPFVRKVSPPAN